ncbi:MAG: HAD family hydrolase [Gaiella sp.]
MLRAVLLDVDFTLFVPGPELGPEGYARAAVQHGVRVDPARYDEARLAALADLEHHPELEHDEEIWVLFTEDILRGMGAAGEGVRPCAEAIVREWERHENFFLYDDALPTLATLRAYGLRIGLISNGQRDLEEFAAHHGLDVDVAVGSKQHGFVKPHRSIFERALAALDVAPAEAAMVGDSVGDDIEGARALGIRAFLLDRDGRHPPGADVLRSLRELPAALRLGE